MEGVGGRGGGLKYEIRAIVDFITARCDITEVGMVKTHMSANRFVKWFLDGAASGANPFLSTDEINKLKQKMSSHHEVWANFCIEKTDDAKGFDDCLKEKKDAWVSSEFSDKPRAAAAADVLYRVLKGAFLDDFMYMASKPNLTLDEFLRKDSEHEIDNLRVAYIEFLDKCSQTACGVISEQAVDEEDVTGLDDESELKNACKKRR